MKTMLRAAVLTTLLFAVLHTDVCRANGITPLYNSLKITFLSWGSGSTKLSYERALPTIKQSAEL